MSSFVQFLNYRAKDLNSLRQVWYIFVIVGSVWIASELKGLNDECEHFEVFPPGHLYSSKDREFRRWYNPPWFNDAIIPTTPYDPLVLRNAFEKVRLTNTLTRDTV